MTTARPWVRGELPWLRSGPLFRVHVDAVPHLDTFLERWSFRRFVLDGGRMISRLSAHNELSLAFGFPDYYGRNWDAFNDSFGDFVEEHDGERFAVIWNDVERAASVAPVTAVEVGWALLQCAAGSMPSLAPGTPWSIELEIFAVGGGDDFDRAEPRAGN